MLMEISAAVKTAAAVVTSVGVVGGGALTLDKMHVSAGDFDKYIEQQQISDERDYVRRLKEDIRNVMYALSERPGDEYLLRELDDLVDELCEYRPEDRLCNG